jgi:hypothetical protein
MVWMKKRVTILVRKSTKVIHLCFQECLQYPHTADLKASDVMKFENMLGSFTVPLSMDLIKRYNVG